MKTRVVVPSWSRLPPDMEAETACRFAAFVPLGGQPLYRHLLAQHARAPASTHITFILAPQAPELDTTDLPDLDVSVVRLERSASIGETVLAGLRAAQPGDAAVVNMADTLVKLDQPAVPDAVYTQMRSDLYRWTSVVAAGRGAVRFPHDRDNFEPVADPQEVCVGLFSFSDACRLRSLLESATAAPRGPLDPFFSAIEQYSQQVPLALTPASGWFDCGHVDTYYESRLGYQNLRHFNTLTYEPFKGQVTKTSAKEEQFRHQVRWFKQVPDALAAFLPRIFDSSDGAKPFLTMELLSIPTLAEIFVTERLNPGAWNGVVRTIAHIQAELARYSFHTPLAAQLARSVYLDKTKARLAEFLQQDKRALEYGIATDAGRIGLAAVLEEIDSFVEANGLLEIASLSPIHGDFCFSNLLFDPKVRVVKMIDPRGEFGVPGIYGDPRYDLAKLAHSFSGGYDFIVSDRFSLSVQAGGEIAFASAMGSYHQQVQSIFELILLGDPALNRQVLAIQALLFLSMLPLHVDAPRRQLAMLATGLRLFAQARKPQEGGR